MFYCRLLIGNCFILGRICYHFDMKWAAGPRDKAENKSKLIKAKNNSQVFKFSQIYIEEVKKSFQSLDPKKVAQKDDVETNLLKKNVDCFAKCTCDEINDSIRFSNFPNELK